MFPQGGVKLVGYSSGAILAYDIGRLFHKDGVPFTLTLIDPTPIGFDPTPVGFDPLKVRLGGKGGEEGAVPLLSLNLRTLTRFPSQP